MSEKPSKRFILAPVGSRIFCTSDFLSGVNAISLNLISLEKLNLNIAERCFVKTDDYHGIQLI